MNKGPLTIDVNQKWGREISQKLTKGNFKKRKTGPK